jgi:hypothetical protein
MVFGLCAEICRCGTVFLKKIPHCGLSGPIVSIAMQATNLQLRDDEVVAVESDDGSNLRSEWVHRILKANDEADKAIITANKAIIELGRILNEAKAELDQHGQWLILFERNELPFSLSLAERYMRIVRKFQNSASLQNLPSAVSTLYELSRWPKEKFDQAAAEGKIHLNMTCKEAASLGKEACKEAAALIAGPGKQTKPPLTDAMLTDLKFLASDLTAAVQRGEIKVDQIRTSEGWLMMMALLGPTLQ